MNGRRNQFYLPQRNLNLLERLSRKNTREIIRSKKKESNTTMEYLSCHFFSPFNLISLTCSLQEELKEKWKKTMDIYFAYFERLIKESGGPFINGSEVSKYYKPIPKR